MSFTSKRSLVRAAGAVVFGTAAVLSGVGFAGSADDPPIPEKKAAAPPKADSKTADQKPGFDPKDVRIGPPPELAALRTAVEEAARKGENVDEIRKQLDALEKALAGKPWVKPKVVEDLPAAPAFPGGGQPFPGRPGRAFPVQPVPAFPGALQFNPPDMAAMQKAQDLLRKSVQLAIEDPVGNKEKVEALRRKPQELMARAVRPALGGELFPLLPGANVGGKGRLGVRVDRVPEDILDLGGVPAGRGVLVGEVLPDSAAEKAGLKAGDVITEFAGKPVTDDPGEFVRTVSGMKAGAKVDVGYVRNGKKGEVKGVQLADAAPAARFGADVVPLFPAPGVFAFPGNQFGAGPFNGGARTSVTVKVENGAFTINAEQDGVKFHLEGTAEDGKPVPAKIKVTDGKKTVEAKSVDGLPAEYRDRVKKILEGVRVAK